MSILTILEAYYGAGVVLDYADDAARDAAFALGLSTIAKMEGAAVYDLKWQSIGGDDVSKWHRGRSRAAALRLLRTFVAPEYRYFRMLCRAGSREYFFSVLSEDGSCVDLTPGWEASNAWYDAFWAALWDAGQELDGADLVPRGGEIRCEAGHRRSPFVSTCEACER